MRGLTIFAVVALLSGCATEVAPDVRKQLAPSGSLRVGLNMGNTLLTGTDPVTREPRGIAVDLARELAKRLGVPAKFLAYPGPGELGGSIGSEQWDIAFFAIEPARAGQVDFSPGYVEIETTYIVRADSSLHSVNDVDHDGVVVTVTRGAGYEPIVAGILKYAKLIRTKNAEESYKLLNERQADANVGLRPMLLSTSEKMPQYRVVSGRFATVQQAIGVQKGRGSAAAYIAEFLQDVKQSGLLARVIADHNVKGLTIAK